MLLPYLSEVQSASKKYSVMFRGINYGEMTQDGEFADTLNLSTDKYPYLTQRSERIKEGQYTSPSALHAKGGLLVIDGTDVLYGGVKKGSVSAGKKQIATVGKYIIIFPDKVYYDTEADIFADMEATYTAGTIKYYSQQRMIFSDSTITTKSTDFFFTAGDVVSISGSMFSDRNKESIVIRAVSDDKKVLIFDENSFPPGEDFSIVKITRKGFSFSETEITTTREAFDFKEGDAVTISGCSVGENNKSAIIRAVSDDKKTLTFYENTFTVGDETGIITIKRDVPDLDFICESNYRLWGTHGNTIYASKYSDPFNFKIFDGLSSDSYYIDVGSEGEFTGCIPYSSHICFFKENTLHKLYGSKPSNFQITTVNVYGVQSGSEKSMHIVNEMLLYKGVGGVYAYTGGVPELVSECFGNRRYSNAVACCDGEKYYISMRQGNEWCLFAYDVTKNIWLKEDHTQAVDMVFHNGRIYFVDTEGGLYYIDKTSDKSGIEWSGTFCTMHETVNERKGYSKFHLRLDLSAGAWLAVDIKTDRDTQWRQIFVTHNQNARTVSVPIIPTRCDSIDIRLRGMGECTIKAFIREFTVGSDV